MIHKTIEKQATIGKHRTYHEHSLLTSESMLRDQIISIVKKRAIGSEIKAVDKGDSFVIHDIMKRMQLFPS